MIAPTLRRLLDRRALSAREAADAFDQLLRPEATDLERAALLVALGARELTEVELAAFAAEMRRRARRFPFPAGDAPIDLCGSGGARTPSFNVSTVSAFVVAAAGVPVIKHGNRSASGICGSSDLLEALGLPVAGSPEFAASTYRARRLAFLHAPLFHPATRAVAEARRALGVPTVFNHLGPLSNPARVPYQLAGAASPELARRCAGALRRLGVRRGASMTSTDGCDEFSPRAPTLAYVWDRQRIVARRVRPETHLEAAERRGPWSALPPRQAAAEAERILRGGAGARRGSVLLTSGFALWIAGAARSMGDGLERARTVLDGGAAYELLGELRTLAKEPPEDQR